jgi:HEAT repeat protein
MDTRTLRARLADLHAASPAERRALRALLLTQLYSAEMPLRALAAAGLGRVGDERALPALVQALRDPEPLVQWQAAHALRALHANGLVSTDRLLFQDGAAFEDWKNGLLARLVDLLSDPSRKVRLEAAFSLAEIGEPATLRALTDAALDSEDPVCWEIGQFIMQMVQGDSLLITRARGYLTPGLRVGDPWMRQVAAGLLAELGDRAAVADLLPLLHDAVVAVRSAACAALGHLHDPVAGAALIGPLADDNATVRAAAALALGRLGASHAFVALSQLAHDEHASVRSAVMTAFGQIGVSAAQPLVLQALQDADATVRLAAIQALALLGDEQALKPLAALGRDHTLVGERRLDREAAAARKAIRLRMQRGTGLERAG